MRDKIRQFMQGRYGVDQFGRFLMICGMASIILHMVLGLFIKVPVLYYIALAALIYGYFRMLSRNFEARRRENSKYLELSYKASRFFRAKTGGRSFGSFFQGLGNSITQFFHGKRKSDPYHRIFRCPGCGQKVRVPKGRGRISIRCPKCGHEFIKRT